MMVALISAVPATVGAFVFTAPVFVVITGAAGPTVSVTTVSAREDAEALPARSVALTVSLCEPSVNVLDTIEYLPSAAATAEPMLLAPSKSSTLLPASAVPVMVGVAVLVIPSMAEIPVSEFVSNIGVAGVSGAFVSMVTVNASETIDVLPAASLACTFSSWVPSARVALAMVNLPVASAVAVPRTVVPSSNVTVLPASAVPTTFGVLTLVILSVDDWPESDATSRENTGLFGATVSTVNARLLDPRDVFPPLSTVLATRLCAPSLNLLRGVATQLPLASVVVVPTNVVPSNKPIVLPATAVPATSGEALFVKVIFVVMTGAFDASIVR